MESAATEFFASAAIFAVGGMIWGIQMFASHDHSLNPALGHLNLIGFLAMAVLGSSYLLKHREAATRLALIHYVPAVAAVLLPTPGIAVAIAGLGDGAAKSGSVQAVLSTALLAFTIPSNGVGATDANRSNVQGTE